MTDADGRSSFQAPQDALKGAPATIDYAAFDLLEFDRQDLTSPSLVERKANIRAILPDGKGRIRYSDRIFGNGEKLLNSFCQAWLKDVISKRATGKYVGSRSGGWLKTKSISRQEFGIVGWAPSNKSRFFRSLKLTAALREAQRKGGIFVDYLRNQRRDRRHALRRSRPNGPVALPITWERDDRRTPPLHDLGRRRASEPRVLEGPAHLGHGGPGFA